MPCVQRSRNSWRPVVVTGGVLHEMRRAGEARHRRLHQGGRGQQFQHRRRNRHRGVRRVAVVLVIQARAMAGRAVVVGGWTFATLLGLMLGAAIRALGFHLGRGRGTRRAAPAHRQADAEGENPGGET